MSRSRRRSLALVGCAAVALATASCSTGAATSAALAAARPRYALGVLHQTWTDPTRATPANGAVPGHAGRTLETTIIYPVAGHTTTTSAPPHGPFPLIVFAHGLGADIATYMPLLEHWAAAGFVVAAPLFPVTNSEAAGGPNVSDYVNQPADMSFVVTRVLDSSATATSPLHGLVDAAEVGAAGHSLGGVTTLGLIADTCCHDPRIRAAVVMAGDQITFPTGKIDYGLAPPVLFVHGDNDAVVPYSASVTAFNRARPPKGLLTIKGGNHDAAVNPKGPGFASVTRLTTEFFDAYLKHDRASLAALTSTTTSPAVTFTFTTGGGVTLPVPTEAVGHLRAAVVPDHGLTDGTTVTVSWAGFSTARTVNVLQCSRNPPARATDCDLKTSKILAAGTGGDGETTLVVHTGAVGAGTCGAGRSNCVVVVNQGASLQPAATVVTPISFAP